MSDARGVSVGGLLLALFGMPALLVWPWILWIWLFGVGVPPDLHAGGAAAYGEEAETLALLSPFWAAGMAGGAVAAFLLIPLLGGALAPLLSRRLVRGARPRPAAPR